MGMKQTLDVINRMESDGVIGRYTIAGVVAAYNYVEPTVTGGRGGGYRGSLRCDP
jgi:hypothetical protein